MKKLISKTGIINGRGSDRYKWISNLTKEEREHVRSGGIVLVPDDNERSGCDYKRVTYFNGKYGHCNY